MADEPSTSEDRLLELFGAIQAEFDVLRHENRVLRKRLKELDQHYTLPPSSQGTDGTPAESNMLSVTSAPDSRKPLRRVSRRIQQAYQAGTTKLVSTMFRNDLSATLMHRMVGHTDGLMDVSVSNSNAGAAAAAAASADGAATTPSSSSSSSTTLVSTVSADQTARIWTAGGTAVALYNGHRGSVNSCRFHPKESDLVCSASGDGTVHLWRIPLPSEHNSSRQDPGAHDDEPPEGATAGTVLSEPKLVLDGHSAPVVAADWVFGENRIASGSWDRTLRLWDAETGSTLLNLGGHEHVITNVACHPSQKLIVSSSRDATFRLWDFRQPAVHEVNVFQGHNEDVTSAVFAASDANVVVSGSDDRTVRVWDLRNMRASRTTIKVESGVNRLSVSSGMSSPVIAVPLDNGRIRLFNLSGASVGRIRRREAHQRPTMAVAWSASGRLYSAGFDGNCLAWKLTQPSAASPRKVKTSNVREVVAEPPEKL